MTADHPHPRPEIGSEEWVEDYGLSSREVCRLTQLELAREDDRLLSLEGDLAMPSVPFHEEFPERFLQIGISEADLVTTAVGLSKRGKIPFVNSFAAFTTLRACEQVVLDVSYQNANVKLMGYYAGTTGGQAASTHFCLEDLAITRTLPNFVVLSPADSIETYKAVRAAHARQGPVYIRLGRAETPQVYHGNYDFEIGKAVQLADGDDVTLIATGVQMVAQALRAAETLAGEGIQARVLNVHTLKPLDREAIADAAAATGAIVTVEDHNVHGGLGCAVAEVVLQCSPVPILRVGVPDCFPSKIADQETMLPWYDMDAAAIAATARRAVALRDGRS